MGLPGCQVRETNRKGRALQLPHTRKGWFCMLRKLIQVAGVALLIAAPAAAADDPGKLTKAEFQAVAIEGLKNANGVSRERAAARLNEILDAAKTYPGSSNLARQVRTGYGHYENSRNIRKNHAQKILKLFADADVAQMSDKEAAAVISAWPQG